MKFYLPSAGSRILCQTGTGRAVCTAANDETKKGNFTNAVKKKVQTSGRYDVPTQFKNQKVMTDFAVFLKDNGKEEPMRNN